MISTKNLVTNFKAVPSAWVFEYYCRLKEKLTGQDIKINSVFNPQDKTPSLAIYYDVEREEYRFKCFSTGSSGSSIDLVKKLKNCEFGPAVQSILADYNVYILKNKEGHSMDEFKVQNKYRVTSHEVRPWNTQDQYLWTQFRIGTRILNEHNVKPLESYTMTKVTEGVEDSLTITGQFIYGYFTNEGILYKIYQPKIKEKKFIKVQQYIQGTEQLKGYDYLAIVSGLKDMMSLKGLGLKLDYIAPDSENTMIPKELMLMYIKRYKKVFIFLDNDDAGIKAMKKYREEYGIACIFLTLEKDSAESIRLHGPKKVIHTLVPLINQKISEY